MHLAQLGPERSQLAFQSRCNLSESLVGLELLVSNEGNIVRWHMQRGTERDSDGISDGISEGILRWHSQMASQMAFSDGTLRWLSHLLVCQPFDRLLHRHQSNVTPVVVTVTAAGRGTCVR